MIAPNLAKKYLQLTGMTLVIVILLVTALWYPLIEQVLHDTIYIQNNNRYLGRYKKGDQIKAVFVLWNVSFHKQQIGTVVPTCACSLTRVSKFDINLFSFMTININIDTNELPVEEKLQRSVIVTMANGKRIAPLDCTFSIDQ